MLKPLRNTYKFRSTNDHRLLARTTLIAAALMACVQTTAFAQINSDADLERAVKNRFEGDRVARCLAVAYVGDKTSKAYVCTDPKRGQRIDDKTAFEIGSISKTMLAFLVADLVDQGKMKLEEPLQKYLPEGSTVPTWKDKAVTVQHVVTHTSGIPRLPEAMDGANPADPYATLTPRGLLDALKKTKLNAEPGSKFEYSNFAMMLLSLAVSNTAKQDLETLFKQRLFEPTGMRAAYVSMPASGVYAAQGYSTSRRPVPPWTIATDLAGVGMVRATLDDMVAYARAAIGKPIVPEGRTKEATRAATLLANAHKSLYKGSSEELGMNWFRRRLAGGVEVVEHGGGTGGFSSYLVIDRANSRAVVLLSDTSGAGISKFADALLDGKENPGTARRIATPDKKLLDGLVGEYTIGDALPATLRTREGKLFVQAAGQPEFEMGYDTTGTFFVLDFDAVLKRVGEGDTMKLSWAQGGAEVAMKRRDPAAEASTEKVAGGKAFKVSAEKLAEYSGVYPLAPTFKLTFTVQADNLTAQATGQGAFALQPVSEDHFAAPAFGIKVWFKRGADGKVNAIRFMQGANDLAANRE
jgi:serine-type D-Ala-D-Ala carboxypeptidase/endopeptidase